MRRYPFLAFVERYGVWLSPGIAIGFLGLCLVLLDSPTWVVVAFACLGAAAIWLLLSTLTDIVRLLAETLIPRP